jgi:putative transposase
MCMNIQHTMWTMVEFVTNRHRLCTKKRERMLRTACIRLDMTPEQADRLSALRTAYADACNRLVPLVQSARCWNRVALHQLGYRRLREETALGAQMACNAIFSVCKAYRSQRVLGRIAANAPVPVVDFNRTSVHFDHRTYTLKGDAVSLSTLRGRMLVPMILGDHQRELLRSGRAKEAELVWRRGRCFFNLVVEFDEGEKVVSGPVMGVDVGENTLAAGSTGRIWGGEALRHRRDQHLALRRRLQSNGSQSAKQRLRQVSGRERRRVTHINHQTSKGIVAEARRIGAARIVMEDITNIRERIRARRRVRARLHRWAFRQLQGFVEYKARAVGITVEYVNPAYTSRMCSACGKLGTRLKHRFECSCGFRAHADLNASWNLVRIGAPAVAPRAAVNTPDVGCVARHASP